MNPIRTAAIPFVFVLLAAPSTAQITPPLRAAVVVGATSQQFVKTLDLNGDGWMDAMGWWRNTSSTGSSSNTYLYGFINDQTGQLVSTWNLAVWTEGDDPLPAEASAVADLDGDGRDDFVMISGMEVRVYLARGSLPAQKVITHVFAQRPKSLALADFDLDGAIDLAVETPSTVSLHAFDLVTPKLDLSSSIVTNYSPNGVLVAAELTGDATPDILLGGVRLYPVVAGSLQPYSAFPGLPIGASLRHDAGDIDGDGDTDILSFVVPTEGLAQYRVLRRVERGTLVAEPLVNGGPGRYLIDIDGDGDLDGACCGGGGTSSLYNKFPSTFRIAFNDGTGVYAPAVEIAGLGSRALAGAADLDHDGDIDLVAGRCVYYADGPIRAEEQPLVGSAPQTAKTLSDADMDGDPDVELALGNVHTNLGDGIVELTSFPLPDAPAGYGRWGVPQSGDFDGDGDVDLIAQLLPLSLELLRNVGCGRFESAGVVAGATGLSQFPTPTRDVALAADYDGDGDRDLIGRDGVFTTSTSHTSTLWRNDGVGGFVRQEQFAGRRVTWVGNIDGDAYPDLLAYAAVPPSGWSYRYEWSKGLGDGAFGAWTPIGGWNIQLGECAVADFSGDGDFDIVTIDADSPNGLNSDAYIYWNDGHGVFQRRFLHDGGFDSARGTIAATADLDQDGKPDLILGPLTNSGSAAYVLLHDPVHPSTFLPAVKQVLFELSDSTVYCDPTLAFADADGDGDLDVMTKRRILNNRFHGSAAGKRAQSSDGVAGFGGVAPILGASGPFRVGETVRLRARGLKPGSHGLLVLSTAQSLTATPAFGHAPITRQTRAIPVHASGAAGDPAGSGAFTFEFSVPGFMAGWTRHYRVVMNDASAPGGHSRSNDLELSFGL